MAWHSFFRTYLTSFIFWLAILLWMLQEAFTSLCSYHQDHLFILTHKKTCRTESHFWSLKGLHFLECEAWIRTVGFLREAFPSTKVFSMYSSGQEGRVRHVKSPDTPVCIHCLPALTALQVTQLYFALSVEILFLQELIQWGKNTRVSVLAFHYPVWVYPTYSSKILSFSLCLRVEYSGYPRSKLAFNSERGLSILFNLVECTAPASRYFWHVRISMNNE